MNRKLALITAVLIFTLIGCSFYRTLSPASYQVKQIADGDTITVVADDGTNIKVRFSCVDAPEIPHTKKERNSYKKSDLDQFKWGRLARNRLTKLLSQSNNNVALTITDSDQYGRKVAEVRLPDGTLVQEVLAREGLVMVYHQYIKDCPSAAVVEQSEEQARKEKAGIWGDPKFTPPWEYRRMNRMLTKMPRKGFA